ncbi:DUF4349 domain-containing protein [Mucilaginibacter myungsuensis]|uniref:DUF4349 domain-containing protein n=1 Tax=Mucilaginibacter myungsuensis TaxID=649104 RepID=A0A929L1D5_9SPHI|nr:DUF4349 domain-containing protein [Mucilaginibacter myungsuensis]MBE9661471.1 DUF4349 domain-containing protein [Mucilaginibacter myungsuensis]MDN3597614.1 DUF4349 domain-containing protein [Mucilaginibacter myungsuensis]
MRNIALFVGIFAFTICVSCSGSTDKEIQTMKISASPDALAKDYAADEANKVVDNSAIANKPIVDQVRFPPPMQQVRDTTKKVIKTGDIRFESANVKESRAVIIASLKKAGGYVAQESETSDGEEGRKEYTLNARIPGKAFETFLSDVSNAAAHIDSKNISTEDVTAQYIDLSTRLQNKKALEQRYLALLKQANKMSDVLEVENKLTEIRSDIESQQGQLNYLSKQVAYSTLDITFYTKSTDPTDKGYGAGYKFKRALSDGWELLQGLFFGIIGLWPVMIIIAILILLFKRWRRKRRSSASA